MTNGAASAAGSLAPSRAGRLLPALGVAVIWLTVKRKSAVATA